MEVDPVFPVAVMGLIVIIVGLFLARRERKNQKHLP